MLKNHLDPKTNVPMFFGLLVVWITNAVDEAFIYLNNYIPDTLEVSTKALVVSAIGIGLGKIVQTGIDVGDDRLGTIPQKIYEQDLAEAKTYNMLKDVDPHS